MSLIKVKRAIDNDWATKTDPQGQRIKICHS
jgi:hypothetical protein